MTRYVYEHPMELGLGQHHADEHLGNRLAEPIGGDALRAVADVMNPTDEQRAELDAFLSRTMEDLDMAHGTEVEHTGRDEGRNLEIVEWSDKHGDPRRTSIEPDFFAANFREVTP
jgi:hypothetical protein